MARSSARGTERGALMETHGWAAKIGLAIASAGMSLLLAECALATFYPQDRSVHAHTADGLTIHPASIHTYLPQFGRWVRTNEWGLRDRSHALEKADGTFRILVLGDSFMEALQVDFEESLPHLLETALSARIGHSIEVINASTGGWGTDDEVEYLERYGTQFHPDLVLIAFTVHNDVINNLELEHHDFQGGAIIERPRPNPGAVEWALIRTRDFIAERSHVYGVYRRLKALRLSRSNAHLLDEHVAWLIRRDGDPSNTLGWEVTRQLLDRAHRIGRGAGAQTVVVVIPHEIQVSEPAREKFLAAVGMRAEDVELDQPQNVLAQWGAHAGVAVIDLAPEFRASAEQGKTLYLENDGHWTRDGHALAAAVVVRELAVRGLVRAGKSQPRL